MVWSVGLQPRGGEALGLGDTDSIGRQEFFTFAILVEVWIEPDFALTSCEEPDGR